MNLIGPMSLLIAMQAANKLKEKESDALRQIMDKERVVIPSKDKLHRGTILK